MFVGNPPPGLHTPFRTVDKSPKRLASAAHDPVNRMLVHASLQRSYPGAVSTDSVADEVQEERILERAN